MRKILKAIGNAVVTCYVLLGAGYIHYYRKLAEQAEAKAR